MGRLCQMKLEADVRAAMAKLPNDTLDFLYSASFNKIISGGLAARDTAMRVFSWLLCLQEPLSPAAFLTGLSMADQGNPAKPPPTLSEVLDICSNLVIVDPELEVLRFAHVSVQEFLETNSNFLPSYNHRFAAVSCLNICTHYTPTNTGAPLNHQQLFYHYGLLYFAEHIRLANIADSDDELLKALKDFVFCDNEPSLAFISWVDEVKELSKSIPRDHRLKAALNAVPSPHCSPLYTACTFGLQSLIEELAKAPKFNWNQKNDTGHPAIYLAAAFGHERLVDTLVQFGANVNATGGKFGNSLQAACFYGHDGTVQELVNHGADPYAAGLFDSALTAACMGNHEGAAMLLLKTGSLVTTQDEYDQVLRRAAEAGFMEVIHMLQQTYSQTFGRTMPGQYRALQAAIMKGQEGVVVRFLDNPQLIKGVTDYAIYLAALGGANSVIRLLLNKGFSVDAEGPFGTPLRVACIMGHYSTVQLLLDSGADVNLSGLFGDALQAAAMKGHTLIVKLLLQAGSKTCSESGLYGSAFRAAGYNGHVAVVEALLDASPGERDRGAWDALDAAAAAGFEEIVILLTRRGYMRRITACIAATKIVTRYRRFLRRSTPSESQYRGQNPVQTTMTDNLEQDTGRQNQKEKGDVLPLSATFEKRESSAQILLARRHLLWCIYNGHRARFTKSRSYWT